MVYMRIHCGKCGGTWEVYHNGDWKSDSARECPHCFHSIDKTVWERDVLPVFGEAQDSYPSLLKENVVIDYIGDKLFVRVPAT